MSLFDKFEVEYVLNIKHKLDEELMNIVENQLYPQMVKYIEDKVFDSLSKGYDNCYIITHIANLNDGVFKYIEYPLGIEIDDKKFLITSDIKKKYNIMMIDMFINDYTNSKKNLLKFDYEHDNKYYSIKSHYKSTLPKNCYPHISMKMHDKLNNEDKYKFKLVHSDRYTFKFEF